MVAISEMLWFFYLIKKVFKVVHCEIVPCLPQLVDDHHSFVIILSFELFAKI